MASLPSSGFHAATSGQNQLALVVEDDDALRQMMVELLQLVGFSTMGCKDGFEAVKAAQDFRPSVLTLDLHMPGMDGVEVLTKLNEDEGTSDLPVVIVSAYTSDRRLQQSSQVKAIIQKPFDVEELFQKVLMAAQGQ